MQQDLLGATGRVKQQVHNIRWRTGAWMKRMAGSYGGCKWSETVRGKPECREEASETTSHPQTVLLESPCPISPRANRPQLKLFPLNQDTFPAHSTNFHHPTPTPPILTPFLYSPPTSHTYNSKHTTLSQPNPDCPVHHCSAWCTGALPQHWF